MNQPSNSNCDHKQLWLPKDDCVRYKMAIEGLAVKRIFDSISAKEDESIAIIFNNLLYDHIVITTCKLVKNSTTEQYSMHKVLVENLNNLFPTKGVKTAEEFIKNLSIYRNKVVVHTDKVVIEGKHGITYPYTDLCSQVFECAIKYLDKQAKNHYMPELHKIEKHYKKCQQRLIDSHLKNFEQKLHFNQKNDH